MTIATGTRFGPYDVISLLGSGGMGEVYRARDSRLGRDVALKVLPPLRAHNPRFRQRFEREARAVAALSHPHICRLHDVGSQDGTDFLVMEFVEGDTLEERIRRGPLPIAHVLQYGAELADALQHAHRRGIIHRDLKPSNVMLTKSGVTLLDFGIMKYAENDGTHHRGTPADHASEDVPVETISLDDEHAVLGTLAYSAPEVLDGGDADVRSDIFGLGCVVYEMAVGRRAFDARTRSALVTAIREGVPQPPHTIHPSVPPALERVISKCLDKDPDRRWQSARDLADELQWIASDRGGDSFPVFRLDAIRKPRLRPWTLIAAILLIVGALAATRPWLGSAPTIDRVVKFSIMAPEESRFQQGAAFLAVSPDGRNVAYIASLPDGTLCLWVRPLDSMDARPLAGTEGAGQPFWSPDGRFIAYTQDEKLKKIAVSGEPPQTVAESPVSNGPQGGSWSIDDVILFTPNRSLGLYRVSAAGGVGSPVVATDDQHGEIAVGWPTFLPDGRHFLYRVLSDQDDHTGIFLGSLESRERQRLTSIDSNTAYVEPGFLVYQQEGVLTAQQFDVNSFRLVGNPTVLARQLTYNHVNGRGSFSATERVLAYREVNDARLSWLDRNGVILSSIGEPAHYLELALSPDGNRALVTRIDGRRNTSDVWLVDTIHGLTSQLTFAPSSEQTPIWSPNGDEFVFAANPDGFFNLYRRPVAAGGAEQRLLASKSNQRPLDWSRGGRLVFEQSPAPDRIGGLWLLPLLQPPMATRIDVPSPVNGASAQISPDGHWLAWVSAAAGREEVYVQAFPIQGDARRISSQGGTEPLWRRDMTELFYLAPNGDLMAVPITKTPALEFGTPKVLFGTPLGEITNITGRKRYDVTPDGSRFLMAIPRGGSESAPITVMMNWAATLGR